MNFIASMASAFATMHAGVPYSPQARNRAGFQNFGGGGASMANDGNPLGGVSLDASGTDIFAGPHGEGVSKTAGEAWEAYVTSTDASNTGGKKSATASAKGGPQNEGISNNTKPAT